MPRAEPVLILDLDGTILRRNSFPVWAGRMLGMRGAGQGLRQRLALSLAVQRLLWRRKRHRLNHDGLMRELQMLWQSAVADSGNRLADDLQNRLERLVRPNIAPVLRLVADDAMDGILATAAAADYAVPLGRKLGFTHIIATPAGRSADEPYNFGPHKRDRVLALLRDKDWAGRPRIFFNDDMADLPLMQASHAVCWYGSNRGLREAKAAAPAVRFLPCRNMRPGETTATIAHLSQSLAAAQLAGMPWVFPAARSRSRTSL
jgi:phosphoserine phosphatase